MFKYLSLALLLIFATPYCFAQDAKLWIDGVNVKLGMPRDQVEKLFSVNHVLKQAGNSESWVIAKKGSEINANNVIGMVTFKDGKLEGASQNWGRFISKDAMDLSKNLLAVLNSIQESGENIVPVKTNTNRSPEITENSIELTYKSKKVTVFIGEGRNIEGTVVIQENLIR
ncbi:MAG: hypothetical protein AB1515_07540 [Nitrospirota bacterium]